MSEFTYDGNVNKDFIEEALEAYRIYKIDREPLITRI